MKIPCDNYRDASRRLTMLSILVFPLMGGFGVFVAFTVGQPAAITVRDFVGGNLGKMAGIVTFAPFAVFALLLPLGIMILIDRRIGIRCPDCNVSLTLRCSSEKVLLSRKCCHCDSIVMSGENQKPSRPKENLWRVVPLSIIFVGCIAGFVVQSVNSGKPLLTRNAIEVAVLLIIILAVCIIRSTLKRRRKQEASGDELQDEA